MKKIRILILVTAVYCLFFSSNYGITQTWWHSYRDPNILYQGAYDISKSTDGNFFISGEIDAYSNKSVNIIKINKYGNIFWSKIYADSNSLQYSIACTASNDNGCVVTGLRYDLKPFAIKINSNGDIVWNKTYENYNISDRAVQIVKASDNGYILCGLDYLLKIDSSGNYLWSKTDAILGISGDIYSVDESFDGGYICLGDQIYSPYPTVVKLDYYGNKLWQKDYIERVAFVSLIRKLSNCYLLMGDVPDSVPYPNTNYKYYFAKIDMNGNEMSHHSGFDSTGKTEYFGRGLHVLDDNRFIFSSMDNNHFSIDSGAYTVFKIVDSTGIIKHKKIIINTHSNSGYDPNSILPLPDGYIMCVGASYLGVSNRRAVFMARMDTTLYIDPVGITSHETKLPNNFYLYQNYPNPFNQSSNIKFQCSIKSNVVLKIYDITGRKVQTIFNDILQPGTYEVTFDGSNLASGIYFYSLFSDSRLIETKKMLMIK